MPLILFGGFVANSGTLPKWIEWVQYLSPIRYGLEALVRNEYQPMDIPVNEPNPIVYLNFNIGKWRCVFMLAVLAIAFRILALVFLKIMVKKP